MLNEKEIITLLRETNALIDGHFLLSSGLHSESYVQCALLLKDPKIAEKICTDLADKFRNEKIDLVVGPALGGVIVAYEVARQLGVPNIFAERENGQMTLRRGFSVEKGKNVLVIEDVITTGGSSQEVVELLESMGANVIAAGSIIDRSKGEVKLTVPFKSLLKLDIKTYTKEKCPLCADGTEAIKPGSRR
ncbi:orotate phosphoribosyltransferase [Desulfonispora thiosulfatigenes DSM 11270]|uniref:Orotate phosphoribosyltransferase n=1 Tax=Desulfonispora thiosulfatigenes DSM 11270 TaxID=656914 RepID=A0A1W1VGW8_DESTI|nr:orotate phosphoribosyltransferase [Desulfonispora thiosulfatigenes]SMB92627.1 orotate phosphoribosyltransferase [Desulfonispora thiosulfatigenes DSM 11270]